MGVIYEEVEYVPEKVKLTGELCEVGLRVIYDDKDDPKSYPGTIIHVGSHTAKILWDNGSDNITIVTYSDLADLPIYILEEQLLSETEVEETIVSETKSRILLTKELAKVGMELQIIRNDVPVIVGEIKSVTPDDITISWTQVDKDGSKVGGTWDETWDNNYLKLPGLDTFIIAEEILPDIADLKQSQRVVVSKHYKREQEARNNSGDCNEIPYNCVGTIVSKDAAKIPEVLWDNGYTARFGSLNEHHLLALYKNDPLRYGTPEQQKLVKDTLFPEKVEKLVTTSNSTKGDRVVISKNFLNNPDGQSLVSDEYHIKYKDDIGTITHIGSNISVRWDSTNGTLNYSSNRSLAFHDVQPFKLEEWVPATRENLKSLTRVRLSKSGHRYRDDPPNSPNPRDEIGTVIAINPNYDEIVVQWLEGTNTYDHEDLEVLIEDF